MIGIKSFFAQFFAQFFAALFCLLVMQTIHVSIEHKYGFDENEISILDETSPADIVSDIIGEGHLHVILHYSSLFTIQQRNVAGNYHTQQPVIVEFYLHTFYQSLLLIAHHGFVQFSGLFRLLLFPFHSFS